MSRFDPSLQFIAIVVDADAQTPLPSSGNLQFIPVSTLLSSPLAKGIYDRYAHTNQDHFRWALKPILLLYLLDRHESLIFLDPDMYFVGPYDFLYRELQEKDALLAPHWSEIDPLVYEDGLFSVMRNGLYSGGFIGANQRSRKALEWWAGACHYKMDESPGLGVFVDQKYLDLFVLLLENPGIIRHPGCNLTNINLLTCKRSVESGMLKINKNFDPIFIHFTRDTIYNIDRGNDPLLRDYLDAYRDELRDAGFKPAVPGDAPLWEPLKRKLRLRTRIKKWLFRLAQKL